MGRYERRKELRDTGNKENITVKERKGKWNYRKEGRGEKEIRWRKKKNQERKMRVTREGKKCEPRSSLVGSVPIVAGNEGVIK